MVLSCTLGKWALTIMGVKLDVSEHSVQPLHSNRWPVYTLQEDSSALQDSMAALSWYSHGTAMNSMVRWCRFTLGNRAPTITGVKVYGSEHSVPSEINMEVDFAWNGNQNMELFVRPVPKSMGPATIFAAVISQIVLLKVNGGLAYAALFFLVPGT